MSTYDPDKRKAAPPDDRSPLTTIEVSFAIPTWLTENQKSRLAKLINEITRSDCNQPVGGTHWVFRYGSKPQWSQADALAMGKPVSPLAPEVGEPTFNESVMFFETFAREKS